nr:hypothetical protein BgiMline_008637 [Biomphalaria glabrata]
MDACFYFCHMDHQMSQQPASGSKKTKLTTKCMNRNSNKKPCRCFQGILPFDLFTANLSMLHRCCSTHAMLPAEIQTVDVVQMACPGDEADNLFIALANLAT